MSLPNPQPIATKTSTQDNEVSIATSISDVNRFFQPRKFRVSKHSPPNTVDVNEMEFVVDKTALRVYTKVNGSLRYWSLT